MKEVSPNRTNTVWIHFCEVPRGVKFVETESRSVAVGTGGGRQGDVLFNARGVYFGDKEVSGVDCGDEYKTFNATELYIYE